MPRRARLMLAGMPVHITHRGNNRQRCFYEDSDRDFYLFHLRRLLPQAQCALHAYCLMTNHIHLLVTPARLDSCARLMKGIAQLHTQHVNRTYGRTGTLWEGRFDSCIVQTEDYLLNCYLYVERNPVEAGLCNDAADYEWSSCRTNAYGVFDQAITPHDEYLRLGGTAEVRRATYRGLVASPVSPKVVDEVRKATSGNFALGTQTFKRSVSVALARRAFPGEAGRPARAATDRRSQGKLFDD